MECVATLSEENASVAVLTPPVVDTLPEPSVVAPSLNVTVPVGTTPAVVTVAVKVTDWLNTDGFVPELTVVVLLPLFTV